jgi:hypothetical protein
VSDAASESPVYGSRAGNSLGYFEQNLDSFANADIQIGDEVHASGRDVYGASSFLLGWRFHPAKGQGSPQVKSWCNPAIGCRHAFFFLAPVKGEAGKTSESKGEYYLLTTLCGKMYEREHKAHILQTSVDRSGEAAPVPFIPL